MIPVNEFLNAFHKNWKVLKPFKKITTIALLMVFFLFIISVILYPSWRSTYKNIITLVGVIFVSAILIVSDIFQTAATILLEYRIRERTRNAFTRETNNSRRFLEPKLRGIPYLIPREEIKHIVEQINIANPILVTGEAGTGKSGIAVTLVSEAEKQNIFPLLIDARRIIPCNNATKLKEHFDIDEPVIEGIERIGEEIGIWVMVDQLDNIAGSQGCNLIIDTLIECSINSGVSVIVISRHQEANEKGALRPLLEKGFIKIQCNQLPIEQSQSILREVGVLLPSDEMLNLATNLLNLDLICEIAKLSGPSAVIDLDKNTDLWARYIDTIRERENLSGDNQGDKLFEEAINLAHLGLTKEDRTFMLNYTLTMDQRRLVSNGIIIEVPGFDLIYQFRHEKLQDYLYARHACNHQYLLAQVQEDINSLHLRNILLWMSDLYQHISPTFYKQILEELLDG